MRRQGRRRRWCPRQHALTTRIRYLRMKRCGSVPALTVFDAYAPTSDYENEEVEAFYVEMGKFYKEDHSFYKVIVGVFNTMIGLQMSSEELHVGAHGLLWNEQAKDCLSSSCRPKHP
ncbi:unnamed protein product [Heligmosomoides polygyrus]|uniref:GLOBIN domain-containing protein n=1 Tax=Heligmosomoides polygyrus TaxID=6339 RepID=A0A183FLL2_HELPZ|nr:unnamed protein product [Heligmosomoides polygyrus]